jgi:hypothetical protein
MLEKARPRYSASAFIDAKINKLGDWRGGRVPALQPSPSSL